MQVIILSVGDELVLGQTVDTNSAYLSAQLARRGISTLYHQTISDDRAAIAQAIRQASEQAPLVIVSGGIGPTEDDLTRHALADALRVGLVLHEQSLQRIRALMEKRGRKMPERNQVQAMHPAGTEVIPNTCGTAPGIKAQLGNAVILVTPGVPREMVTMFQLSIVPEIDRINPDRRAILTTKINTFGQGESTIAQQLGDLMDRRRNPTIGTTVGDGIVSVRIRSEFDDAGEAQRELEQSATLVEERLSAIVFGRDDQTLPQAVLALVNDAGKTLATAESCTGGLLGKMLTDVPGASRVYVGGWVTYSNHMKSQQLGVPAELIEAHGAVSEQVVRAMAREALGQSGAGLSVAITGIAGPEGGTDEKPVGTVWVALGSKAGDDGRPTVQARQFLLPGDRDAIRDRGAKSALQMLRLNLMNQSLDQIHWGPPQRPRAQ